MNQNEFFFCCKALGPEKIVAQIQGVFQKLEWKKYIYVGCGWAKNWFPFFFFNVLVTMQVGDICKVVGYVLTFTFGTKNIISKGGGQKI